MQLVVRLKDELCRLRSTRTNVPNREEKKDEKVFVVAATSKSPKSGLLIAWNDGSVFGGGTLTKMTHDLLAFSKHSLDLKMARNYPEESKSTSNFQLQSSSGRLKAAHVDPHDINRVRSDSWTRDCEFPWTIDGENWRLKHSVDTRKPASADVNLTTDSRHPGPYPVSKLPSREDSEGSCMVPGQNDVWETLNVPMNCNLPSDLDGQGTRLSLIILVSLDDMYETFVKKNKKPWITHEIKYALVLDVHEETLAILYQGEVRIVCRPAHITEKMLGKWLSFWCKENSYSDMIDVKPSKSDPFPVKGHGPIEATVFIVTRNLELYPIGQQHVRGPDGEWQAEPRHPETLWSPEIHAVADPLNCLRRAEEETVYKITAEISFSLDSYLQNPKEDPKNFLRREVKTVLSEAHMEDQCKSAATPWMRDHQLLAQQLWISPNHKQPTRTMLDKVKESQTFVGFVQKKEKDTFYVWSYDTLMVTVEDRDRYKLDLGDFVTYKIGQQYNQLVLPITIMTRVREQLYDVRRSNVDVQIAVSILVPFDMQPTMDIGHVFLGFMTVSRQRLVDVCQDRNRELTEFRGRELKLWFRMIGQGYSYQTNSKNPVCWEIDSLHESMYSM